MSNNKTVYNTISAETRNEIKKRFESGEHLIDLAIEYKINFNTLKNYASKKKWVKGKRVEITYALEFLSETEETVKNRANIKKLLDNLGMSMLSHLFELEKNKQRPTNKNLEEAIKNRFMSATIIKDYMKDIHNFRSPEEQARLLKAMLELEKIKELIEEENGDIDYD